MGNLIVNTFLTEEVRKEIGEGEEVKEEGEDEEDEK